MHIIFEKALRLWMQMIQYMLMSRALYRGFLIGFLPQYPSFLLQYPLFRDVSVVLVRRTIWLEQIYLKWLLTSFLDNLVSKYVRFYDFCFSNGFIAWRSILIIRHHPLAPCNLGPPGRNLGLNWYRSRFGNAEKSFDPNSGKKMLFGRALSSGKTSSLNSQRVSANSLCCMCNPGHIFKTGRARIWERGRNTRLPWTFGYMWSSPG